MYIKFSETGEKVTIYSCLNCGESTECDGYEVDELGAHLMCPKCGSSFDIDPNEIEDNEEEETEDEEEITFEHFGEGYDNIENWFNDRKDEFEREDIEILNDLDDDDLEKLDALIEAEGRHYVSPDIAGDLDEVDFYKDYDLARLAEEFVDEGMFGEISDTLKCHLDYESLGRELGYDDYTETERGVIRH